MTHPENGEPDAQPDDLPPAEVARLRAGAATAGSDIQALQAMPASELLTLARREGLDALPNLDHGELLFALLEHRFRRGGLGWAEGVLEVLPDGFGFLRSVQRDFEPGPDDVYVSPSQVRRLNLKPGHQLAGPVRPPRRGEKFFALLHVERINGGDVEALRLRLPFAALTPVLPHQRLRLDHPGASLDLRAIELLSPWGRGQRVLVGAPHGCGRTRLLRRLAEALLHNHADLRVCLCLLDERPEEVPELRQALRSRRSDVVASTFDQPTLHHLQLAEMALLRAMRHVEAGEHVVLLVDSLTALARACNLEAPPSGRLLCPGLDAAAVQRPKRLFGAARSLAEGGSLTVIATALCGTDSRIDQTILDEFGNRGNADVVFDRELAELHVPLPLDVLRTSTRREDLLLPKAHIDALQRLRQRLAPLDRRQRVQHVVDLLQQSPDNDALLQSLTAT